MFADGKIAFIEEGPRVWLGGLHFQHICDIQQNILDAMLIVNARDSMDTVLIAERDIAIMDRIHVDTII